MGTAQPGVLALTQGALPFFLLHQAVQVQRRGHDSEFLKIENVTEGETSETPIHQKLEVLVRVDKTNIVFTEGERQCSYKLGPGQDIKHRG